jgi:hypothetical protein
MLRRGFLCFGMALLLAALPCGKRAAAQGVCPVNREIAPGVTDPRMSVSETLNVPDYRADRPLINADYVTIEYNAASNQTSWADYNRIFDLRGANNRGYFVPANGTFLPVIYNKEKIAVRVCGLHFTDVLTVTTSQNGVPEGGADIRGAAPVTPPSTLTSSLDMLQSGTATGGATALPGLGLNAPGALQAFTIAGITPGFMASEDQTPGKSPVYTPATVTISGRQVALMLFSVSSNALEIKRLIDRSLGTPYAEAHAAIAAENADEANLHTTGKAPGSVEGIEGDLKNILAQVKVDAQDRANNAAFDKDMTDIQNLDAQISTLATSLSGQSYASNALTLLNNYSMLTGMLNLANLIRDATNCQITRPGLQPGPLGSDDLKNINGDNFGSLSLAQIMAFSPDDITQLSNKKNKDGKDARDLATEIQKYLRSIKFTPTAQLNDQPLCSAFEQEKIAEFLTSYQEQVGYFVASSNPAVLKCHSKRPPGNEVDLSDSGDLEGLTGCWLFDLNDKLDDLRNQLKGIDIATAELYDRMNQWYSYSNVEQTDLLQPLTTNTLMRISIVVQRGYTPFTLANASGTLTPTVTANVPASAAAASTSTPAHAVKTILVEVHRMANFNLVGGVMLIHIPTRNYALQSEQAAPVMGSTTNFMETCGSSSTPVTPPSSGAPPSYSCVVETQPTQWQVAAMAGVAWFPFGHDYFPRHNGFANFGRNLLPSLLLATSVTTIGNAMGGVNWEPASGLNLYAGIGSANRAALPAGVTTNTIIPSGTTLQQATQVHAGLTLGVGFDLNTLITLFSSKVTSVATTP